MKPVAKQRNLILFAAVTACFPMTGYAVGAARIDFAIGNVSAINGAGVQRPLSKGAEVFSGETVSTGPDGRAQIRFSDGAMISLQPKSDFRLDNYHFTGQQDGSERGFFSLLKGGFRAITGFIGRANKDNYKVTTAVATIGIRGTEYTVSYLDSNGVAVSTGEGAVQVCNAAGCVLLSSGDSAIIHKIDQPATRSDSRPRLDPPQAPDPLLANFSTSDARNADGSPVVIPSKTIKPLVSGPGYTIAFAGNSDMGTVYPQVVNPVTATFGSSNELLTATNGSDTYTVTNNAGALSADGILGWGRWSTGSRTGSSTASLSDFHYIVGKPTATSELTNLAGITAIYNLIGYTLPTTASGVVGTAPSGTLTASFGALDTTISINLSGSVPSGAFSIVASTAVSTSLGPTFSMSGACASVQGFFAGTNASHAGVTYQVDNGSDQVFGSAAFKR